MKKRIKRAVGAVLALSGVLLIAASVSLVLVQSEREADAADRSRRIVSEMYELMPQIKAGSYEERQNVSMPMLEIDGESFVGIIEIPRYNVLLPVSADGDSDQPYKYAGSLYDGSLAVSGATHVGQLDFMSIITETDEVAFTDVMGYRYSLEVYEIIITDEICSEDLDFDDADLVLFAKVGHSSDYTVVKCKR